MAEPTDGECIIERGIAGAGGSRLVLLPRVLRSAHYAAYSGWIRGYSLPPHPVDAQLSQPAREYLQLHAAFTSRRTACVSS